MKQVYRDTVPAGEPHRICISEMEIMGLDSANYDAAFCSLLNDRLKARGLPCVNAKVISENDFSDLVSKHYHKVGTYTDSVRGLRNFLFYEK